MRAAVVPSLNAAPTLSSAPQPVRTAEQQTLVRMSAATLNPIDLHIAAGKHPLGAPAAPFVPGVEGVGVVVESERFAPGARVRMQIPGGFVSGSLGEIVVAADESCVAVPDGLTDVAAAAIGVVGVGAHLSSRLVSLTLTDSVLILGATGGFGQAFLRVARAIGVTRVIGASRDRARLDALELDGGVTLAPDLAQQLDAAGGPVSVVLDPLWGEWARPAIACLDRGGRYLSVGDVAGSSSPVESQWFRHRSLSLLGFSGSYAAAADVASAYAAVADLAAEGRFDLVTETYDLGDVTEAWNRQLSNPAAKIVVTF